MECSDLSKILDSYIIPDKNVYNLNNCQNVTIVSNKNNDLQTENNNLQKEIYYLNKEIIFLRKHFSQQK
jgi:hypothetical protein